jgi:hypothetical protein
MLVDQDPQEPPELLGRNLERLSEELEPRRRVPEARGIDQNTLSAS